MAEPRCLRCFEVIENKRNNKSLTSQFCCSKYPFCKPFVYKNNNDKCIYCGKQEFKRMGDTTRCFNIEDIVEKERHKYPVCKAYPQCLKDYGLGKKKQPKDKENRIENNSKPVLTHIKRKKKEIHSDKKDKRNNKKLKSNKTPKKAVSKSKDIAKSKDNSKSKKSKIKETFIRVVRIKISNK